ncbi:MAG: hypothetical protein ACTSQI_04575 [Candidatus Helarchaeota archaeon]
MATEEIQMEDELDSEFVNVAVKKKYLELFREICEENELDPTEELQNRIESALVDSFHHYTSRTLHKDNALKFLKGGKCTKRIPGFDLDQIERLLDKMDSIEDQIKWLKTFLQQLIQTKQTIFLGPRGLTTVMSQEEQYTSLTPYIQAYPLAINEIRKKIRLLEAQQIVSTEVVHKM